MFEREALADLHRVVGEWLADHGAPRSVTEAEELARQVAQTAGAAVDYSPPGGVTPVTQGTGRGCTCE